MKYYVQGYLDSTPSLEMTRREKTTALFNDTEEALGAMIADTRGEIGTIAIAIVVRRRKSKRESKRIQKALFFRKNEVGGKEMRDERPETPPTLLALVVKQLKPLVIVANTIVLILLAAA